MPASAYGFNRNAPRRPVNLSLNSDLVARARAENLNLSAIAEAAIQRAVAQRAAEKFREEIARSIAEHEEYLAEYGSFAESVRQMLKEDDAHL
ncbi:MAG: type II toxin-antitoxin system CcdA family antitoxin [Rhodospirillales bacterium]|nr:type II toxin-antitoxin system CcdA family antitoxin [Rhodospirillales bacterium]